MQLHVIRNVGKHLIQVIKFREILNEPHKIPKSIPSRIQYPCLLRANILPIQQNSTVHTDIVYRENNSVKNFGFMFKNRNATTEQNMLQI
jgi:hypothetical protein